MKKQEDNNEQDFEVNIPLYRMSKEVKEEVAKALNFWKNASFIMNPLLTEIIIKELSNPYTTLSNVKEASENSPNEADITSPVNDRIKNGVVAFKDYLSQQISNCKNENDKKLYLDIKSVFELAIESVV